MSMIEAAVVGSKRIETILKKEFEAQGKGLHECLTSVERRIPELIVKKARYIASIRNKVVHENADIPDIESFNQAVKEVVAELEALLAEEQALREKQEREAREKLEQERQQQLDRERLKELANYKPAIQARSANNNATREQNTVIVKSGKFSKIVAVLSLGAVVFLYSSWSHFKSDNIRLRKENSSLKTKLAAGRSVSNNEVRKEQVAIATLERDLATLRNIYNAQSTELLELKRTIPQPKKPTTTATVKPEAAVGNGKSLLSQVNSADSEYENAKRDIESNLYNVIAQNMTITTGQSEVFQDENGLYGVRIPVSWRLLTKQPLELLNTYFNGYNAKPLQIEKERFNKVGKLLKVSKHYAESSSSVKAYSGRLFEALQQIEIRIVAQLGNKRTHITIAGNADCSLSGCRYKERPNSYWAMLVSGSPGDRLLSYGHETPVVIKGLSKEDLSHYSSPEVKLAKQLVVR